MDLCGCWERAKLGLVLVKEIQVSMILLTACKTFISKWKLVSLVCVTANL